MITKKLFIFILFSIPLSASEMGSKPFPTPATPAHQNCDADLKQLVSELEDVCLRTRHPISPFWQKKRDKIEAFLNKYPAINPDQIRYPTANSDKDRPLHEAVIHQDFNLAKLLIEHGAHVQQKENERPLLMCSDNIDLTELLLEHKADINACDNEGNTVLFQESKPEVTKLFAAHGINSAHCNRAGETPLYVLTYSLCGTGIVFTEKAKALIAIGVPVDPKKGDDAYYAQFKIPSIAKAATILRGLTLLQELQLRVAKGDTEAPQFLNDLKSAVTHRRNFIKQKLQGIFPNDLATIALEYYELGKLEFTPEELALFIKKMDGK